MDEEFTTTAYPNVQENLKLTVNEPVISEEPASSTGTLSSLQYLAKYFCFGDQFFNDKPSEANNEKTTTDTEADHGCHHIITRQPLLSPNDNHGPSGTLGASGASGSSQSPPPPPPPSNNQGEYTAWTKTGTRLKSSVSPIPKELHMDDDTTADEQAYSSSGEDIGRDHIPTVNLRQSWWKPLTEDRPATPEPAWSIPSSDLTVPTNNWASALKSTYAPPPENSLLTQIGDMATFIHWYCKKQGISKLTQKDLEGPAYEIVKVFHPKVVHLQFQMEECHELLTDQVDDAILRYNVSKPLPLGGDPGHVTIQPDFFFNKDLEYLWYSHKLGRPALSISKMEVVRCMVYLTGGFKDNGSTLVPQYRKDYIKMEMQIPRSSRVKFIATCSYSRLNDFITSRKNDPKLPQTLISTSSSVFLFGNWKRISEKRTKNQAKTDKTKHGVGKRGKAKVKSKPKSTQVKVNPEKSTVNTEADIEEY
ncbi:hypothetical protein Tco_0214488 [Tanacetum coccineum]